MFLFSLGFQIRYIANALDSLDTENVLICWLIQYYECLNKKAEQKFRGFISHLKYQV